MTDTPDIAALAKGRHPYREWCRCPHCAGHRLAQPAIEAFRAHLKEQQP